MRRRTAHGTRDPHTYRHTLVGSVTTCPSEKRDKQRLNRALRRQLRVWDGLIDAPRPAPVRNEVLTPWDMGKDGKSYWGGWIATTPPKGRRPHRLYQR